MLIADNIYNIYFLLDLEAEEPRDREQSEWKMW